MRWNWPKGSRRRGPARGREESRGTIFPCSSPSTTANRSDRAAPRRSALRSRPRFWRPMRERPTTSSKGPPLHDSQQKAGGIFRRAGVWKRARYFSNDFSCRAEIENVRNNVGMIDVSTLGKFRIFGPDALKALQRVYVGDMSKMTGGKGQVFGHVQRGRKPHRRTA